MPPVDPQLRGLLREWRPGPALPPRFQESVWRRLEPADPSRMYPLSRGWERFVRRLLQPGWATAGLMAVVLLGGLSGFNAGAGPAQRAALGRYVASVDPFQKGR